MPLLKCRPSIKSYLWGGDRLKKEWGFETDAEIAAEAWMLSCHPDGPSVITNGAFAGKTLPEALAAMGPAALGTRAEGDGLPILIKLIDARKPLSIQVHPDDAYAMEHEHQRGKTEMWYILDAEEGAFLYYGFSQDVTEEEFRERIRSDSLTEILKAVPVHKGDVFFIPPGTLHAIGAGILIAEIQQSSNVTYRVFDYGRRDAKGQTRQLHIEQAVAVTKRTECTPVPAAPHLASCPFFTVDHLALDGKNLSQAGGTVTEESFLSILVIGGSGSITLGSDGERVPCRKGDSLFLPASSGSWTAEGELEILLTHI